MNVTTFELIVGIVLFLMCLVNLYMAKENHRMAQANLKNAKANVRDSKTTGALIAKLIERVEDEQ